MSTPHNGRAPSAEIERFADPAAHVKIVAPDFGPRELVALSKAATPQTKYGRGGGAGIYQEIGRTGLRHWGGFVFEEWLRELQYGRRAAEVYREMMDGDPVIGGMMYAIEMLVRRVDWWTEPASKSQLDQRNAAWHNTILDDLQHSWADNIAEIISFLGYGWSWFEEVYKQRGGDVRDPTRASKYDDGTIGLRKLAIRSQDSLWQWRFDDATDDILGMVQNAPPDYQNLFIPYEKSLLFRTKVVKNNPEGRSVLRSAYRAWYFLKNIQNVEGIGIERDLAGLPMLEAPEGLDIWNTADPETAMIAAQAKQVVSSIRRDEQEGILLPFGWKLSLLSAGGKRQLDTTAIITRYEQRIATSVLLDVILLGQDNVGSYALAGVKKGLFTTSLEAYLDQIADVWNNVAIPRLFKVNNFPVDEGLPKLRHGRVEAVDLETLGDYVGKLAGAGAPLFGNDIEDPLLTFLLEAGGMPMPGSGATPETGKDPTSRYRSRSGSSGGADDEQ